MQNTSKKRVRGRTRFSLRVTAHSRANPLGKVKTCACPLSIFFIGMTHKVFLCLLFSWNYPKTSFFHLKAGNLKVVGKRSLSSGTKIMESTFL